MPALYVCPICKKSFPSRVLARDHVKTEHQDRVLEVLSQLPEYRIRALKKRRIDPENWAAGWLLSMLV